MPRWLTPYLYGIVRVTDENGLKRNWDSSWCLAWSTGPKEWLRLLKKQHEYVLNYRSKCLIYIILRTIINTVYLYTLDDCMQRLNAKILVDYLVLTERGGYGRCVDGRRVLSLLLRLGHALVQVGRQRSRGERRLIGVIKRWRASAGRYAGV